LFKMSDFHISVPCGRGSTTHPIIN
jgi:hypothetical protein